MSGRDRKLQGLLDELVDVAQGHEIEVRAERFLREVSYRVRSGSCRLRGRKLIFLDRELPLREQVELLVDELRQTLPEVTIPSKL